MEDIKLLESVERYIKGEMKPDERVHFEQLRKTNPDVDQLVVEHTIFLHQMNELADTRNFKSSLHDVHVDLAERGLIDSSRLKGKAKVIYIWRRYRRVAGIAASIAGITALFISALVVSVSPKKDSQELKNLSRQLEITNKELRNQKAELNNVKHEVKTKVQPSIVYKSGGTGFLIDANGYILTSAHVIRNARNIAVQNRKGETFSAELVINDASRDLALLKINDTKFESPGAVPYSIGKSSIELAEPVYTMGYPRDEIVYGQGYLSAKSGFNGDTLSCQIAIAANPGNSGGPILNSSGEVIGILRNTQPNAEGVVFAVQAKYVYTLVNELRNKNDSTIHKVRLPSASNLKGLDRVQQVKKMEDFVFMVKID